MVYDDDADRPIHIPIDPEDDPPDPGNDVDVPPKIEEAIQNLVTRPRALSPRGIRDLLRDRYPDLTKDFDDIVLLLVVRKVLADLKSTPQRIDP